MGALFPSIQLLANLSRCLTWVIFSCSYCVSESDFERNRGVWQHIQDGHLGNGTRVFCPASYGNSEVKDGDVYSFALLNSFSSNAPWPYFNLLWSTMEVSFDVRRLLRSLLPQGSLS